ncbi:hypothetical protein GCM10009716_42480 [Streptomyces sodiiphilus]|uniref:4'-phosphopantetheinyl transferase domain-containing protein n=2 Tax=Streptomyces sodiiphilus TaxID=226217 RepID=A0ABP5B4E6_9ACTN
MVTPNRGLPDSASRSRVLEATGRLMKLEHGRLRLGHESGGRPRLTGLGDGVHVSLSHGRGYAALGFTTLAPLGVDVEVVRPVPAERLADRWFTSEEAAWVRSRRKRDRAHAFFWLWTQKEAMGKAIGSGLADGGLLRPATLPRSRFRPSPAHPLPARPGADRPTVAVRHVRPGVLLAVAVLGRHSRLPPVDVRCQDDEPSSGGSAA